MINSGLNPVIADMTGILLFIGIMQATGFLDVIVRDIVRAEIKLAVAPVPVVQPGYCCRMWCFNRFLQPVITAVITGPKQACVLGVDPNKVAGIPGPRRSYRATWQAFTISNSGSNSGNCRYGIRLTQCSRLNCSFSIFLHVLPPCYP